MSTEPRVQHDVSPCTTISFFFRAIMSRLWSLGYSAEDIITNVFRVCKTHPMAEYLKLEFIKEIGMTHMRIVQGTSSKLQMAGLIARLCQKTVE